MNESAGGCGKRNVQPEENKDLRPNAGRVIPRVRTKSLEGSEYNEYSCPAVVERERQMDKELVRKICGTVGFLDDVVDVLHCAVSDGTETEATRVTHCHSGADEKGKYECCTHHVSMHVGCRVMSARTKYILLGSPKVHIYGVEYSQKRETPGDSVDNDLLPVRGKLVDDGAQQEKVNE